MARPGSSSWIASGSGGRRATSSSASWASPCSSPISWSPAWWRSCAGSEPGAARGHPPRAPRPASRGLLQRPLGPDARDQLHARVLRPDLVGAHAPAIRALLLRHLLSGRALGHPGPGRHHDGGGARHGISARLAPRADDEPLEAGAPRLRPLAAPRGHRHPLLRLDDPARRPRARQRHADRWGLARQAAAPHVQSVRRHRGASPCLPALHGPVAHRRTQATRPSSARGRHDAGRLAPARLPGGDAAALPAGDPGRLAPRLLAGHQLLRGAHPAGRLQGPGPAHDHLRADALGLRLAVRRRQRLRPARAVRDPDRALHPRHRARAPGHPLMLRAVTTAVYGFLLLPLVVVVLAAFNAGNYFTFPPQGFSLKWFANFFARREFMQALCLSTELAFWTAGASVLIGLPAAVALVRGRFRGRDGLNAFVMSPLLLPQILTGVAMLQFFTMLGWAQTYWALLVGHVVVTAPYVIRTASATLYHFDPALEEAAQSLGASPLRAFFEVTLGVVKPGVVAGAIFAFAISFDNFTLSLFLTAAKLTPLPIELFAYLKYSFDPTAAAVSAFAIGVVLVLVLGIARLMGLEEFAGF